MCRSKTSFERQIMNSDNRETNLIDLRDSCQLHVKKRQNAPPFGCNNKLVKAPILLRLNLIFRQRLAIDCFDAILR